MTAAVDMDVTDTHIRQRAIQVRDQHLGDGKCDHCPPDGRCEVLALWRPVIYEIGAARHEPRP